MSQTVPHPPTKEHPISDPDNAPVPPVPPMPPVPPAADQVVPTPHSHPAPEASAPTVPIPPPVAPPLFAPPLGAASQGPASQGSFPQDSAPLGYPQPAAPVYGQGAGAQTTKTMSIVSLVLGILGLLASIPGGWGLVFSIGAVVLGHLGQRREKVAGRPFWLTGLITGYIGIVLALIWIAFWVVVVITAINSGSSQFNYQN